MDDRTPGRQRVRFRVSPLTRTQPRFLSDAPTRNLAGLGNGGKINAIFMASPYSYEFYWDGQIIGRSGVVGETFEAEKTGPLDNVFIIPAELLGPGEHSVPFVCRVFTATSRPQALR